MFYKINFSYKKLSAGEDQYQTIDGEFILFINYDLKFKDNNIGLSTDKGIHFS